MCDSDLDYLGRDDFYPIAETLRQELMEFGKLDDDQKKWVEMNIGFLGSHKYFTDSAKKRRGPEKRKRIEELKLKLEEMQTAT